VESSCQITLRLIELRAEFTQSADAALAMFAASIRDQRTIFPNDTDPSHDTFKKPYIDVLKEARLAPEKVAALNRDYKKILGDTTLRACASYGLHEPSSTLRDFPAGRPSAQYLYVFTGSNGALGKAGCDASQSGTGHFTIWTRGMSTQPAAAAAAAAARAGSGGGSGSLTGGNPTACGGSSPAARR
jgi:hypothetical protein